MDYAGINYDYNDNVYLVSNMKPENPALDPNPAGAVPGAPSLVLEFDKTYPGTLPTRTVRPRASCRPSRTDWTRARAADSYRPALLDLDLAAGDLRVDTFGTATTGSNANLDNTLVNGLQLPFDGSTGVVPRDDDARRAAVEPHRRQPAGRRDVRPEPGQLHQARRDQQGRACPRIEFFKEEAGVGATVGTTIAIPSPSTVASLELLLIADRRPAPVRAAYAVDGGAVHRHARHRDLDRVTGGAVLLDPGEGRDHHDEQGRGLGRGRLRALRDPAPAIRRDARVLRDALYRLDVAGSGQYIDTAGATWTPDTGLFSPSTAIDEGATTTPLEIANTNDDVIYRTYRGNVGNVPIAQRVLTYNLGTRGLTSVDLRLHFAERAAGNNLPGERVFDIEAEGVVLRNDFDIVVAAGGQNTAIMRALQRTSRSSTGA